MSGIRTFFGLFAAACGNAMIGTGQMMQKWALNRLQEQAQQLAAASRSGYSIPLLTIGGKSFSQASIGSGSEPLAAEGEAGGHSSSAAELQAGDGAGFMEKGRARASSANLLSRGASMAVIEPESVGLPRWKDKIWLLGMLMMYAGEVGGNAIALAYASTAVVVPLGFVSVLVNAILASRYLDEPITPRKWRGFWMIIIGVLLILFVAPPPTNGPPQLSPYILDPFVLLIVGGLASFLGYLVYLLLYVDGPHKSNIFLYVLVAALFGGGTITASKLLSSIARDTAERYSSGTLGTDVDPMLAGAAAADVNLGTMDNLGPAAADVVDLGIPSYIKAPLCILVIVATGAGQEIFKQKAMSAFDVSHFQPLFFASFNLVCILTGMLAFGEIEVMSQRELLAFFVFFCVGVGLIWEGGKYLPPEEGSRRATKFQP